MTKKIDWAARFEQAGALWRHDGNKKRPYARLTTGLISNTYFNATHIVERPVWLEWAVQDLMEKAPPELISVPLGKRPNMVFGPAMGAITLAFEVARPLWAEAWYTEPGKNGPVVKRFRPKKGMRYSVAVEDVITSGSSVMASIRAIEESTKLIVLPFVLCLVNRSRKKRLPDGRLIVSLVDIKDARNWKEGRNPFTRNGKERVPPVSAKTQWKTLTKRY